ncbi:MAG: YgiQ family radical SAM protein, partial [Defluviitaleaceae bacterium]|nr:YgiQ family radical SAM protein [Defluviitaleaceae bacterium]
GAKISHLQHLDGIVYKTDNAPDSKAYIRLPDFDQLLVNPKKYAESFKIQYENTDYIKASPLIEKCGNEYVIQNPPSKPLNTLEMDIIHGMNFARNPHPSYSISGIAVDIPAISEVKFSIISSRGCFGGCNFCALSYHQGRHISCRSHESIIKEAESFANFPDFKGYIHDVGGPTANFYGANCTKMDEKGACSHRKCLSPTPCTNIQANHSSYLDLLRKLRILPGIKKVFIRSGIRYDYLLMDKNPEFFYELCQHHISGQLKIAPEHISESTLKAMGKPSVKVYEKFIKKYQEINKKLCKNQYLVPYLISSHPGSNLNDAIELACYLHKNKISPEQVQDFYPTPSTPSTCMYFTGLNPFTMEEIYTAKKPKDKARHRALIQYKLSQNYELVYEALILAERRDLIGFDKHCLIRPRNNPKIKKSGYKTARPQSRR